MSSNNYISLKYTGTLYAEVEVCDMETGEGYGDKKVFDNLAEALDYCREEVIETEYGILPERI